MLLKTSITTMFNDQVRSNDNSNKSSVLHFKNNKKKTLDKEKGKNKKHLYKKKN